MLDSQVVRYNCSKERITTNLGHSQLALWQGANLWQLHSQLRLVRNSCCVSFYVKLVLWLLRPHICGGDDLDQILVFVLHRSTDNIWCWVLVLFLWSKRGDLLQELSWGLTGCKEEIIQNKRFVASYQGLSDLIPYLCPVVWLCLTTAETEGDNAVHLGYFWDCSWRQSTGEIMWNHAAAGQSSVPAYRSGSSPFCLSYSPVALQD